MPDLQATSPTPSPSRLRIVADWFGLTPPTRHPPTFSAETGPLPQPGQILLITGPSGSGKSTLLRHCRLRIPPAARLDLDRLQLPDLPLVELFPDLPLETALHLLARVGLAEAHSYLLSPAHLSDGQRWRLRLALALHHAASSDASTRPARRTRSDDSPCILADEFGAILDPVTASIVAHTLRRAIHTTPHLRAILATCRDDLFDALRPDLVVRCDFGTLHFERES